MPAIQENFSSQELCRRVVAEGDPARRAIAIAHLRAMLEQEQSNPHTQADRSYLKVAEMVLDFLEETLNSRKSGRVQ